MRTGLAIKVHGLLERSFPERRVFLKSDTDTRFIRLRPGTQIAIFTGGALVLGWSILATAVLLMDSIGAGNFRDQAKRNQATYEARLDALADERDRRAAEAQAAQTRFNAALDQISQMQSELLGSETRRAELETGLEVVQTTLRRAMAEREAARVALADLQRSETRDTQQVTADSGVPVDVLADALENTAAERDRIVADAQDALRRVDDLTLEIALMEENNDQIFRQLEEALTVSVEPLDKMFRAAGMPPKQMLDQVRRGYSGQGGPLTPLSFSSRGEELSPDFLRANRILEQLDTLNLYRIAAEKAPFAMPVAGNFRFTSEYGFRRDPKTGGRRMHRGVDFAAPAGTDLFATADGVVTYAGWQSGYGRLIKIEHAFGVETRFAHLSKIRVKVGQRVSRGEHIGDMGASGRVTGVHLHYEVRVGGKAVNPMIYIKAGQDVF
ncbi:M23 family metallopeptidase [uncultured Roseobacter sp.]|uniref:M23 family metallopeptidase n=1 Tax=uncultured Roseobacter sp. TaxID=114847 RepID=UPI0026085071|nr:M23 family metallopeptidase [uncultured Roseobacter sp.]